MGRIGGGDDRSSARRRYACGLPFKSHIRAHDAAEITKRLRECLFAG
jgi:hypothetical protein